MKHYPKEMVEKLKSLRSDGLPHQELAESLDFEDVDIKGTYKENKQDSALVFMNVKQAKGKAADELKLHSDQGFNIPTRLMGPPFLENFPRKGGYGHLALLCFSYFNTTLYLCNDRSCNDCYNSYLHILNERADFFNHR